MEGCVYCKNETYCEGSSFGYFLNDVLDSDGKKTGVNRCSPVCS